MVPSDPRWYRVGSEKVQKKVGSEMVPVWIRDGTFLAVARQGKTHKVASLQKPVYVSVYPLSDIAITMLHEFWDADNAAVVRFIKL